MNSWLAFGATLSLIILIHEWGHFIMARWLGVKVERFSFGFGPRLLHWSRSGTEYALSLLPFGGYVKLAGESEDLSAPKNRWEYRARSVGERMLIVMAGPLINYLLGFLLFVVTFTVGSPVATTKIGHLLEGYPAAEAGLQVGDRILAVQGHPVEIWEEMTREIQVQAQPITLEIERDGKTFTQIVIPRISERAGLLGRRRKVAVVGIAASDETRIQRYPLPQAVLQAGHRVWYLTWATFQSLWDMVNGVLSLKESFTGPIGIFQITSVVAQQGVVPLLYLIAVLSTSIGFFNFLPIPVLDGGHLAFLAVEKLRGRPVPQRTQEAMTQVGLGLLLLLLAVVTYNDLIRFDIGGKLQGMIKPR